ncbi:hypothetical protein J3R30DRAFT_651252 [Lentinula aciculospora]|uniref:Uncharacterized protein n=1 Tax=Lentinula aciculospora TaxID=153920 RepID=A0A9W9A5V6_9AGAR|nr:hypothetical protein J3R30DRAFT_651252 [Lentinula aciculospora]
MEHNLKKDPLPSVDDYDMQSPEKKRIIDKGKGKARVVSVFSEAGDASQEQNPNEGDWEITASACANPVCRFGGTGLKESSGSGYIVSGSGVSRSPSLLGVAGDLLSAPPILHCPSAPCSSLQLTLLPEVLPYSPIVPEEVTVGSSKRTHSTTIHKDQGEGKVRAVLITAETHETHDIQSDQLEHDSDYRVSMSAYAKVDHLSSPEPAGASVSDSRSSDLLHSPPNCPEVVNSPTLSLSSEETNGESLPPAPPITVSDLVEQEIDVDEQREVDEVAGALEDERDLDRGSSVELQTKKSKRATSGLRTHSQAAFAPTQKLSSRSTKIKEEEEQEIETEPSNLKPNSLWRACSNAYCKMI